MEKHYTEIKNWALDHKGTLLNIAERFSGSFMLKLVEAFGNADNVNSHKILDNWEMEFRELYFFQVVAKKKEVKK